jgi:hypothetical protein
MARETGTRGAATMSDDDYTGPPIDVFPDAFKERLYRVSAQTGISPIAILKSMYETLIPRAEEYFRQRKLARDLEERRRRRHRKKKKKCRPTKR